MGQDVQNFVAACRVCCQHKASSRPSAGLLHPLSVPRCPWSHISLDFITGLPVSQGNSVIMTVVDCFSKGCHFIPLSGLLSARETGKLIIHHLFCLNGLPRDVVSDRGPQFTSQLWSSAGVWGPRSAFPWVTIPSPMCRLSGQARRWRNCFIVCAPPCPGRQCWTGQNTPITLRFRPRPGFRPSRGHSDIGGKI